jgi:hypothetical protein
VRPRSAGTSDLNASYMSVTRQIPKIGLATMPRVAVPPTGDRERNCTPARNPMESDLARESEALRLISGFYKIQDAETRKIIDIGAGRCGWRNG